MNKGILKLLVCAAVLLTGCEDLIEPAIENNRQLDPSAYLPSDSRFPFGILLNGYNRIPTNSWSFNDVATDDAVSNDQDNGYLKMATGQWTANNNPTNQWTNCFAGIQYLNIMLGEVNKVQWVADPVANRLFSTRIKGEAYGLRALLMYHLLLTHAGKGVSGAMLGVPILLKPQTTSDNYNLPRASFDDCMKQIYQDLDSADVKLPLDYQNFSLGQESLIPAKYGQVTIEQYNRAFGVTFSGLFTGRIAKAVRAQAALLAASPSFNNGNTSKWVDAANYAANVLNANGGLNAITSNVASGLTWYTNTTEIANLKDGANPPEILWRNNWGENRDLEQANFPPTLFGNGRINPSQNLVDAFPMLNGYPITDANSGYNPADPYTNRDPRLKMFVLVNGATAGVNNTAINTTANGTTNDALNKVATSTRTGYYLRKLLRQDVNLNPTSATNQRHYKPHIRYTEIALAYAEAANEAWGPTGTGTNAYSAYDIIRAIRRRAGIGTTNNDAYLESAKGNKETMRTLIRNERRLELCFEGFRFWDLRRWNAGLTEPAKGVSIQNGVYTLIPVVQDRVFKSYMKYGPIPYSEILKFPALEQNEGWN
ncbi:MULTISPECIES: RagB/SusD family nutrient uptake outer membrane protein [unclassified Arcicella]|uniref:RagB/SusD family nutrient uptake outer membrane protein n=1 Tax=unclassified Arcicella TaxID=2644986 RepID=UPI0028623E58|nr:MULTISPECIES: RagB/SusD family nutrient uptake outer membrane protein [unclassified Arcicella]MDR6562192.1 hypothetical protein [Arcicella sp. BE51]MDR6812114.1 hypothetical protein [Arcicella sp. BE140]MDR6823425.1 hypothetical protein [Arcicella sp. BE139]